MGSTPLSTEQEEYLAYIVSSAEQLKHVVSDILDFKELGTELVIERQPVSIRECLSESLQQSGIHIVSTPGVFVHVGNGVPEYIVSDRGRLVQVLVNLMHNTMRFTNRDERRVYISIENEPPQLSPTISPQSSTSPTALDTPSTPPIMTSSSISPRTPNDEKSTTLKNFTLSPLLIPTTPTEQPTPLSSSTTFTTPGRAHRVRITIRDNGVGIDPRDLSTVFHVDNSLSKTKHVVELLGGELSIESEGKGKGTQATIALNVNPWTQTSPPQRPHSPSPSIPPLALSTSSLHPPLQLPSPFYLPLPLTSQNIMTPQSQDEGNKFFDLGNVKVLLAEDNLLNQKVLRRLFNKFGIVPDIASHGAEAVELIRNKRYDIVFMDLHMPVCDGFEATRMIQELPLPIHKPPVYALTASVSLADKERCVSLGMKGHLSKPVSVQALIDALISVTV